jgi:hypothetical protein
MQWTPIRHGKEVVALKSGDYVIQKENVFGDVQYFARYGGKLLTVACDADRAKAVCEEHSLAQPIPEVDLPRLMESGR